MVPAIHCEAISKFYETGEPRRSLTLRESAPRVLGSAVRGFFHGVPREERKAPGVWVLRDIFLDVYPGEVLGVVGCNGAGKSTLLKVLSRITKPTSGRAEIRGRVGTLLEVGTGFHMQLTGRENIFLNGAVLGMSRREIAASFDEIVEFSQCGDALDMPLKHYSTGMQVRLAFAVAAHLRAQILLVDEVLAVADAAFQKKCLGKIGEIAGQGRTVLFTSHNLLAVSSLCTRAICIHKGRIVQEGAPGAVASDYLRQWMPSAPEVVFEEGDASARRGAVCLRRVRVYPAEGVPGQSITVATPFVVEIEYVLVNGERDGELSAEVFNEHGISVFSTARLGLDEAPRGACRSSFQVPANLMNSGTYRVNLALHIAGEKISWPDLAVFEVYDTPEASRANRFGTWPGVVRPHLPWRTEALADRADGAEQRR